MTEVTIDAPVERVWHALRDRAELRRWHGWYDSVREGWVTFAQQLRHALERHPGEDRATVHLDEPRERPAVGGPGERYAWRGLTGEVWFRSEHQLGLTVDQWGGGLLVLQDGSAVLTGCGVTPALDPA